jgi:hypothetical protein
MMKYNLTKLIDRLNRARNNPPDWAIRNNLAVPLNLRTARTRHVSPWDTPVFVEVTADDGKSVAGQLVSFRFEQHNGGMCVVLSTGEAEE